MLFNNNVRYRIVSLEQLGFTAKSFNYIRKSSKRFPGPTVLIGFQYFCRCKRMQSPTSTITLLGLLS
jgi:hypothetical protein